MEEKTTRTYKLSDEPISLDELKSFLWGAATRLRGQIDAAGYKEYIFPLLFFKRISDVYDEQFEGFVSECIFPLPYPRQPAGIFFATNLQKRSL